MTYYTFVCGLLYVCIPSTCNRLVYQASLLITLEGPDYLCLWGQLFCSVLACSFHNTPMPIIQDVLRTKKFSIKASPADGHCLFYSLLSSWNSQLYSQPRLTLQQVKDLLCNELHQNLDIYAPSVSVDKATTINQQLELYLRYTRYKQPICESH